MEGEVERCPEGGAEGRHVGMVVHPVEVELEDEVEDGGATSNEAKEGRGYGNVRLVRGRGRER